MSFRAPRGTGDMYYGKGRLWEITTQIAGELFSLYGYEPIYTPLFESTELFTRGIGEATDVVSKEMYSVMGSSTRAKIAAGEPLKAEENLTLRPEGTASVVRAVIEHGLLPTGGAPVKLYYSGPMFRYERPQKGRLRQFHQLGVEALGAEEPSLDAEVITMMMRFFEEMEIPAQSMRLLINSMGDDNCRPAYREKVASYIRDHSNELCEECNRRADTNPLRAFDCKNPQCVEVMANAPRISDNLCGECKTHYELVKGYLDDAGVPYIEDPSLVRGLDYYTRTVFEVQVDLGLGSQNAIGGGGRYDKLIEELGGKPAPGIGFSLGFERIALVLDTLYPPQEEEPEVETLVYVAAVDATVAPQVFSILQGLRDEGITAEGDHQRRSLKSQLKQADRLGALFTVLVGPDELARGEVTVRDMETKDQYPVPLDMIVDEMRSRFMENELEVLADEIGDAIIDTITDNLDDSDNSNDEEN